MAHFKRGNLQLKTNQQLVLGDSSEVILTFDGTNLNLSQSSGGFMIDTTALIITGDIYCDDLFTSASSIHIGSGQITSLAGVIQIADLEVTNTVSMPEGSVEASDVNYNEVAGATYSTVQEGMDQLQSSGIISGGIISEDSTSTISVTAGTGLIRTSNSDTAPLVFINWPGKGLDLAENVDKAIVVKYNGGSPEVFTEDPTSVNLNDMIILGEVETVEGALFFSNIRQRAGDFRAKLLNRMYDDEPVIRAGNAGLILGESANFARRVTMSAGDVWALLDLESIDAIDTGAGDVFIEYWDDGSGGWNYSFPKTRWPMEKYDNGSGNLATLSNNRYNSLWFYLIPSDNSLHMVYGVSNVRSLAEAEAEPAPSDIPTILSEHSALLGRILFQKDVGIAWEVQTSFETTFNFTATTDHSNLTNLDVDTHLQYSLVDGSRDFTGTVGGIDPVSDTDFVTLQYMGALGTERTRLVYDGTSELDISVEHVTDIKYADFDTTSGFPSWQEGRTFWDNENHTFGVYNDESDITLQVGQETHMRVRNESGATILNGSPVYISGANQGLPTVELAKADNINTLNTVTIATHDISNNSNGYTTIIGSVNNLDTSGFTESDELYVSDSTAGVMTNVRPKSPSIAHRVGVAIIIDSVNGRLTAHSHPAEDSMHSITYTMPLSGVVDTQIPLTGEFREVDSGETTDVTADWTASNQHVYIFINTITGSGDITITGTSLSESTALPVTSDTETISVSDSTSAGLYYQTNKKWWEITNIDIPAGVTAINFDYGVIGYPDFGNRNFRIVGYRLDAYSSSGTNTSDFAIIISKVQDDGNKEMTIVPLENIGVDSGSAGDQIGDNIRTGGDDRSYNPAVGNIWLNNTVFTFKQLDFNTYFTNSENDILGGEGNEGFFIRIEGEPPGGAITSVDFITMYLYYELIP